MQDLLDKYEIKIDYNTLLEMWNESHRHYHNQNHLLNLIEQINEYSKTHKCSESFYDKLILCAIFHDCVYDPKQTNNEELSAEFFINCCESGNTDILEIKQAILDTKSHNGLTELSKVFNIFDMHIINENYDKLLEWENEIYEEYKFAGSDKYKEGRKKFLESMLDKYPNNTENLLKLIDYVDATY